MKEHIWLLLCVIFIKGTASELTLVKSGNKLQCISSGKNDSTALAWVILSVNSSIDISTITSGWTTRASSELDNLACNLHEGDSCTLWPTENRKSNLEINEDFGPVLDHRWNSLELLRTDGSYTFSKVYPLPDNQTTVTFYISVLAQANAFIFLSSGENPNVDQSYWLIVDGWGPANRSAIRRCPAWTYNGKTTTEECRTVRQDKNMTNPVLHSGRKWIHLTVQIEVIKENYTRIILKEEDKVYIDWTDQEPLEPAKFVTFRTYDNRTVYYRFHQYSVLSSAFNVNQFLIQSNLFQVTQDTELCLSVIYFIREGNVNFYLYNEDSREYVQSTTSLPAGKGWQVGRISMNVTRSKYSIIFTAQKTFYIGDIRLCNSDTLITSITGSVTSHCVALHHPHTEIYYATIGNPPPAFPSCFGDKFGPDCSLSCSQTLGKSDCKAITACNQNYECTCLSGYSGTNCGTECTKGWYGPVCSLPCSNCTTADCDAITGECKNGCIARNFGDRCELQKPVTSKPPGVKFKYVDEFTIQVLTSWNGSLKATYYELQYKEVTESEWHTAEKANLRPNNPRNITGLKSSTTYQIRTLLVLHNDDVYSGDDVPYTTATTTCNLLTESDVQYTPMQNSINITWETSSHSCDALDYEISYKSHSSITTTNTVTHKIKKLPYTIKNLESDTNYQISLFYIDRPDFSLQLNVKTLRERAPKLTKVPTVKPLVAGFEINVNKRADTKDTYVKSILLQYKLPTENVWNNGSNASWKGNGTTITLKQSNLTILTLYQVRAVLLEVNGTGYMEDDVPKTEVTTDCQTVRKKEVTSNVGYNFITVNWTVPFIGCPITFYEYYYNGYHDVSTLPFTIKELNHETNYSIHIYKKSEQDYLFTIIVTTKRDRAPKLSFAPKVSQVFLNGFNITIQRDVDRKFHNITTALLQYKEQDDVTWHNGRQYSWLSEMPMSLQGLKSDTEYKIRVIVLETDNTGLAGFYGTENDTIPEVSSRTLCNIPAMNDVQYTPMQNFITITSIKTSSSYCPATDYETSYKNSIGNVITNRIKQIPHKIDKLESDTSYAISLFYKDHPDNYLQLNVKTLRERPPKLTATPTVQPLIAGLQMQVIQSADTKVTYVKNILLQYKLAAESAWNNGPTAPWEGYRTTITLEQSHLKILTLYQVRAVLLEEDGTGYMEDDVPMTEVTTDCQTVGKDEVSSDVGYNFITVNWTVPSIGCPITTYGYKLNVYYNVQTLPFTIKELNHETNYSIHIYKKSKQGYLFTIHFTTKRDRAPKLSFAPEVSRVFLNGFNITIQRDVDRKFHNITTALLQYKEQDDVTWHNGRQYSWLSEMPMSLQGLKSDTEYKIRVIVLETDNTGLAGFYGTANDTIPEVSKRTSCNIPAMNDVQYTRMQNFITITSIKTSSPYCPATDYETSYKNNRDNVITNKIYQFPHIIDKLESDTSYTISLFYKDHSDNYLQLNVKTLRERPPKLTTIPTIRPLIAGLQMQVIQSADTKDTYVKNILLQYKIPKEQVWSDGSTTSWKGDRSTITLEQSNLTILTLYQVRAVLLEVDGTGYMENDVPMTEVTTDCQTVAENELEINPTDNSYEVKWPRDNKSCPPHYYEYSNCQSTLRCHRDIKYKPETLPIEITDLETDTNYTFVLFFASNSTQILQNSTKTSRQPAPYFKSPPVLHFTSVDGFEITVDPNDIKYSTKYCNELQIQYKEPKDFNWSKGPIFDWPLKTETLNVLNLKSNTHYHVRAILRENDRDPNVIDMKYVSVLTSCQVIDKRSIKITAHLDHVELDWSESMTEKSCPIKKYSFEYVPVDARLNKQTWIPKSYDFPLIIPLEPSKEYQISIFNQTTKEGSDGDNKPEPLIKLNIRTKDRTSVIAVVVPIIVILLIIAAIVGSLYWIRRNKPLLLGELSLLNSRNNNRGAGIMIPSELDLIPLPERTLQDQPRVVRVLPPTPATPVEDIRVDPRAGAKEMVSHMIRLQELEEYVETALVAGELKRQHGLFPRGQTQSWDYGRLPANKMKNRYANLVAYDATRVKLAMLHGDPHSDYINANYVDGYKHPRAYIATQGPKPVTVNDFWRMIWQENSNLIIMLANVIENEKKKCEQYWPDYSTSVSHGAITITTIKEDIYADYTFRDMTVTHNNQTRNLVQLHFTSWPDHGVPSYPQSLAVFLKKMLLHRTSGPIVVHCSAGVGRTGTVILTDACLRMAAAEGQMDPLALIQTMRSQRPNMVDNAEQYELVHVVLVECLLTDSFTISCAHFTTQLSQMLAEQRSIMERQFSRLNKLCHKDYLRKNFKVEFSWPPDKSRYPDIEPVNVGRVILQHYHGGRYINAVYVDGFRCKDQFIATQLPMPNTVGDIWHLVMQVKSPLIVLLNQPQPEIDETTCKFWPQIDLPLQLTDSFGVILKNQSDTPMFEHISLQLQDEYVLQGEKKVDTHDMKMLTLKNWLAGEELPPNPIDILELWEETEREYTGKGPIIVMCHDGARACGLFLSSVFTVEKLKLEKEVDVGLAVRTTRLSRPHFITSLDQFEFIYQVAQEYMDSIETYANFQ